nr:hypothetical protein [Tanacetum cinerariifolium]
MSLPQEVLDACAALTRRVEHLEYDKVAQALEITKLKRRVKKLEKGNRVKVLKLRRLKKVGTSQRIDTSKETMMNDASNQGKMIDEMDKDDAVALMDDKEEEAKVVKDDQVQGSQVEIYKIDLDHASKVLNVVTAASETVAAASTIISAVEPQVTAGTITAVPVRVDVASTRRRRKGVVIRDPEEESSTVIPADTKSKDKRKGIMVEEPKPLKKKQQVEMNEEYARKLHAELNKDIDWDVAIDHVKQKAKEDPTVQRYQAKFNSNIKFLLKTKEQIEEEESRAIQSINETRTQKATKRRKLNKEVEDLKRYLEIMPDEDDDVYTKATPLARKVPVVDYEIINLNNKPYYKIIRADGTHQLYISFLTLLKNFNREDLEALWSLVKESTMASAIICLADNQKLNFLKYIFDNIVKSLEGGVKFYMFPRFLQVFLDKQVEGMARHKELYIISSHTKKIFANMRRIRADFSGPLTSKPQKKQKPRRKQRKEAEVSHDKSEDEDYVPTPSSDPLPSGEDSSILNELMIFYIAYKNRGLKRLKKFGLVRRVKSPMEKDGLGAQEDASKQGRMIEEINQNAEIALDDKTQGRKNDDEMFGVDDLDGEEVVMETTTGVKDSVALTINVTKDEVTMAQALAALKSTKPKVVQSQIPIVSSSKDKGKAKMIEPEVPIKRKEQMRIDEEYARKLEVKEQEAPRLSRAQQDEEANNSWDNMQAMIDADILLAKKLQAKEREEFSEVQKARLLVEQIEKRKKHFAALRAREKRNKPPTKTQIKSQISTYLRHMGGYTQSHLKGMSFDKIKKLFNREMKKVDENVEPAINDSEELRKCIEIVPNDGDEVLIEATPISSRSPSIIDYKIHKEGKKTYFKIIRADGNSQVYQTFEKMFKNFNREDLEVL